MKTLKIILIFVLLLCLILIFNFFKFIKSNNEIVLFENKNDKLVKNFPTPTIIQFVEMKKILLPQLTQLLNGEDLSVFFIDNQIKNEIVYKDHPVNQFYFSPKKDKFGYFVDYSSDQDVNYDREAVLYIENTQSRKPKEVFHGTFRTSGWEWFSNDEVLIDESCGTECHVQILENLITGKEYVLQYGVGYTWSPNKKWIFAYNYSYRTGITIGDKFGNIIYKHHILPPENETANTPLAVWSPDSSKLALVMKKSDDKSFELIILNSGENFKEIFKSNVDTDKKFELKWALDGKTLNINDQKIILK